jgi:hypothetical protein
VSASGRGIVTLTRERVLLAVGATSGAVGGVLLFLPGVVPGFGPFDALTDADAAVQTGLLLGAVVAVLAAYQMRRTGGASLDRSDLLPDPPETAHDATVPAPGVQFAETYRRVRAGVDRLGRTGWHVAAYGRRARQTSRPTGTGETDGSGSTHPASPGPRRPARADGRPPVGPAPQRDDRRGPQQQSSGPQQTGNRPQQAGQPQSRGSGQATGQGRSVGRRNTRRRFRRRTRSELFDLLDEVAATARDVYATANDCDEATAERAVETGSWTDDRVAAAFLATADDAPTFTVRERALAWLAPQRTLDRRVERTLDAIEAHTDGYLTYRTPSRDRDDGDSETERGTEK